VLTRVPKATLRRWESRLGTLVALYKLDLPDGWRALYTTGSDGPLSLVLVFEVVTHREYDRMLGYGQRGGAPWRTAPPGGAVERLRSRPGASECSAAAVRCDRPDTTRAFSHDPRRGVRSRSPCKKREARTVKPRRE
jgi:hypothetical protein